MKGHGISLASGALLVVRVASQTGTSNVTTCTPLYQWSINNKNQTPCLVAAFLESVCQGLAEVNSIPVGTHYIGPSPANATPCQCSTVTYSLVSACGGCQERTFLSWTDWAANCREVEVGRFLEAVPTQVIVPSWAYLDVTKTNNTFNPILANQSLSTSGSSSSASISSSTSSTAPPSTSSVSLPSSPTTPQKSKSNAGPIAGGVVGGLVVAVAAGLAILFYLRRRNRTHEDRHLPGAFSTSGPSMGSRTTASLPHITPYNYGMFPKETDISEAGDTFPGSPVTSAGHTTYDTRSVSTPAIEVLHRYTGSGEI
ncbi:hypothetical protein DFH08DRAFT_222512 [Mycena albidolilacea]|uniref:Uncharacterized protein n=1 Tax=Mycena albidolilacea TaxID=1033008 RepID=A0AAD7EQQ3_9AGAR|nr:hypothetical protein DFH08DRAFT_222512 [Mycena albidolilacea]